jgi:hypothetical protein
MKNQIRHAFCTALLIFFFATTGTSNSTRISSSYASAYFEPNITQQITTYLGGLGYTITSVYLDPDNSGNYIATFSGGYIIISPTLSIITIQNLPVR